MEVRAAVWVGEPRTTVELRTKPMGLDPVFWDIVDLPENRKQPLSFRLFGAWTCPVPPLVQAEIPEGDAKPEDIARAILEWADRQLQETEASRSIDVFVDLLRSEPRRGGYLASYVTTLILMHRRGEALNECEAARARGEPGGFSVGRQTFPELALAWLGRADQTQTLH